ncbi:hypothetical protein WL29_22225 [Burkholderia ubonensis]|uniref:Uncharacterized protein n=1 Tax=Burkholderia ubonensis TaxID=101571 RepID=A0A106QBT0_9BURK|nr:hypothetical protein [Burkholderia ubonensis]KWA84085.1 hypothetical protein WL29_22225 [Burkholderia ubonensis]
MSSESILGLQWADLNPPEFRLRVVLKHGAEAVLTYPDTPEGRQQVCLAIEALPLISEELSADIRLPSVDHVCEAVAAELPAGLKVPPKALEEICFAVMKRDAEYAGDFYEVLVGLIVEHHSAQGVRRALFSDDQGGTRSYLALHFSHVDGMKTQA